MKAFSIVSLIFSIFQFLISLLGILGAWFSGEEISKSEFFGYFILSIICAVFAIFQIVFAAVALNYSLRK